MPISSFCWPVSGPQETARSCVRGGLVLILGKHSSSKEWLGTSAKWSQHQAWQSIRSVPGSQCNSWGCPLQVQELDFNDSCRSCPTQDIVWGQHCYSKGSYSEDMGWQELSSGLLCSWEGVTTHHSTRAKGWLTREQLHRIAECNLLWPGRQFEHEPKRTPKIKTMGVMAKITFQAV